MAEVLGTSGGGWLESSSEVRKAGFWVTEVYYATQKFVFHPVGLRFEVYGDICRYQVLKGRSKQPWGVRLEADRPARKQLQKQRGDQGLDIHFGAFNL